MALKQTILVDQGSTFVLDIYLKDANNTAINLAGYSAQMQVRETLESASATITLSTGNGRIAITAGTGKVALSIAAADTAAITAAEYVYDLELLKDATVERILEGKFVVRREVTR